MMAGDRIDLGIRFGAGSWPGMQSELIIPSSYVVVAARSLVGPTREPSLETVTDLPWLQELGTREMEEWAERRDLGGRGPAAVVFMPGNMILPAVRAGCGVARSARFLIAEDTRRGSVVVLDEEGADDPGLGYHLVRPTTGMAPATRALAGWIKSLAATEAGLDS
jgi:LysR family glycine cleavage system transcriptional activator